MLLTAFGKAPCPEPPAFSKTGRMRTLSILLLLAACLQVPLRGYSQGISVHVQDAALSQVFELVQRQSPYRFIYATEDLALARKVSLSVAQVPVTVFLEKLFSNQPLAYQLQGELVTVSRKPAADGSVPAVMTVNGKVVDENGHGLPAVSIAIRGEAGVTATDDKGGFVLREIDPAAVLLFSSIGYSPRQVTLAGRTSLLVQLLPAVNTLDETVIKGYYASSRRLNTGSVAKITSAEISRQPVNNVLAALEGRMPGVFVSQSTGAPGGAITVQVRGRNSIVAGNNPLYIIDGVPFTSTPLGSSISAITKTGSPLAAFSPSDIESIEILKDADATAIYGSRGANGVVLITTKKGKEGRPVVSVNVSTGMGRVTRRMELLNTPQYLSMRREAFANDAATPIPGLDNDINGVWDTTRYTDWQKALMGGTAHFTNAQASLSGGNANTQFLVGTAYSRESTVLPGDFNDQKFSLHFNLNAQSSNKKLKAVISGSYINDNNTLCRVDPTADALFMAPDAPAVYDSLGKLNWDNLFFNPFGPLKETYRMNTDNLVANSLISYEIIPGLTVKASAGYTKIQAKETATTPLASMSPLFGNISGWAHYGSSSASTWIVEPQLEYQRGLFGGRLSLLLGATVQQDSKQAVLLRGDGYLDDALLGNITAASTLTQQTSVGSDNYDRQYKYSALFARINYNLKDKWLLNLTGRRDGSSRFGPGKQYANFGAAGLAWIFSQEQWIKKALPFVSFGKLRGSYGISGNDQIADYGYLSVYNPSSYGYGGSAGLIPGRLFNPDYAWELNKKAEAALELGLLHDRLLLTAAWYRNRSSNQLVGLPLAGITGFSSIQGNLPATVQNSGWEFSLNTGIVAAAHFRWNMSVNLSLPKNKLIAYPGLAQSPFAYVYSVGQPLQVLYKYQLNGVNSNTGLYTFYDRDKNNTISFPGDAAFDKKIGPSYYGGWNNSFSWKQWQLDILFQYTRQTGYSYRQYFAMPGLLFSNQPMEVMQRWKAPGDQTGIQKFSQDYGSAAYQVYNDNQTLGDGNVTNASYGRLKNLSLSYSLHEKALTQYHLKGARLYLQAQNLLTFTSYKGLDPETNTGLVLPPLKVISLGCQFNF